MRLLATALLSLALVAPRPAAAQSLLPSGTGFSLSADASVARLGLTGGGFEGTDVRATARFELAYGATARLSLLAAVRPLAGTATTLDYTVNGYELGLRYLAKAGSLVRPFVEGGFAVRTLRYEEIDRFTSRNVGPWAGLGLMRMSAGHLAVESAITYTSSTFDNWERNGTAVVAEGTQWQGIGVRAGLRYWVRAR